MAWAANLRRAGRAVEIVTMRGDRDGLPARRAAELGVPRSTLGAHRMASPRALTRLVVRLRGMPSVIVHAQDRDATIFGAVACMLARVPFVVTRHVLDEAAIGTRERLKRSVLSWALRRADAVVAVSSAVRDRVLADDHVQADRAHVVVNAFDPAGFVPGAVADARIELGWPDVPTVGMVGVMRPGKGHAAVVEVARRTRRGVRFVLAGDGELRAAIEASAVEAASAGGAEIDLLGQRDDVPLVMRACEVVVLPSDAEALPTVLIEAALMARPVVAMDVGGVGEIVVDGETGLLVPHGDVVAMAGAVERLLADAPLRAAMGARARERALRIFANDVQLDRLTELYEGSI